MADSSVDLSPDEMFDGGSEEGLLAVMGHVQPGDDEETIKIYLNRSDDYVTIPKGDVVARHRTGDRTGDGARDGTCDGTRGRGTRRGRRQPVQMMRRERNRLRAGDDEPETTGGWPWRRIRCSITELARAVDSSRLLR